jgi:hypothetical protein
VVWWYAYIHVISVTHLQDREGVTTGVREGERFIGYGGGTLKYPAFRIVPKNMLDLPNKALTFHHSSNGHGRTSQHSHYHHSQHDDNRKLFLPLLGWTLCDCIYITAVNKIC